MSDFWVFGYGSLMWRPGFAYEEAVPARLPGMHRALCIYSWVHRGTKESPGLVLGLDHGGACRGVAYRVAPEKSEAVHDYLRERELVTDVYHEVRRPVQLLEGNRATVTTIAYVVDRHHVQYAGRLPREELLAIVRRGVGRSGANAEYVLNTAGHLQALGLKDPVLDWLAAELRAGG